MTTLALRRIVPILALGAVGPIIWVNLNSAWALNVYLPFIKWLFATHGIKGEWMFWVSELISSLLSAAAFALALRLIGQRAWVAASANFVLAFVTYLAIGPILHGNLRPFVLIMAGMGAGSALTMLFGVVVLLGLMSRLPRPGGA